MSRTKCQQCGKFVEMEIAWIMKKIQGNWVPTGQIVEVCPKCDTQQIPKKIKRFSVPVGQ
jgi:hypothetical protein